MIGIDPRDIVPLVSVTEVPDASTRFVAGAADWIEDRYGADNFSWREHWHYTPHDLLAKVFTRDELVSLWHGCIFASKLDEHLEEHDALVWTRSGATAAPPTISASLRVTTPSRVSRSICPTFVCGSPIRDRSTLPRGRSTGATTRCTSTLRSACSCTTGTST